MRRVLLAMVLLSSSRVVAGAQGSGESARAPGQSRARPDDSTYFDFQVDEQASRLDDAFPQVPEALTKSRGLACGQVFAEFVVDASGRVDLKTVKVLKTDDPRFVPEVLRMMPDMRFSAAEVGGRKVRELVQMPFHFGPADCASPPKTPPTPPPPRAATS